MPSLASLLIVCLATANWNLVEPTRCQVGFPDGSVVKNPPAIQEMWGQSLDQEDPLENEMTIHSSILAWEIPWTEKPGELQSMGVTKKVRHDLATKQQHHRARH